MNNPKYVFFIAFLLCLSLSEIQARERIPLTDGWGFKAGNYDVWGVYPDIRIPQADTIVSLPHTWNSTDFLSDNGYRRGQGSYLKQLDIPLSWKGKRVFVHFEGAGTYCKVDLNWRAVGEHKGAYTAFTMELTPYLDYGRENYLIVSCDNSPRSDIAPLGGDFNQYGGLYRNVWLEVTEETCISPLFYGSDGLFVTQRALSESYGEVEVKLMLTGPTDESCVEVSIMDNEGKEVSCAQTHTLAGGQAKVLLGIPKPHFWNGKKDPFLYTVTARLLKDGKEIDRVSDHFGLRTFYVDSERGFFLNGETLPLHGVSRHQETLQSASALKDDDHIRDFELMTEMGVTAIRLAHYPQAKIMFDLADRNGIIIWEEIPFVSSYSALPTFDQHLKQQLKEMVYQNYNHPSIMFWGLFNEVMADFTPILVELDNLCKSIDPYRMTVCATFRDGDYNFVTDALAWNKYFGWYDPNTDEFGTFFDNYHREHPSTRLAVSEYGAGSGLEQHVSRYREDGSYVAPGGRFHPMEKQTSVHRKHLRMIAERPYLWASFIWNMFDFGSSNRREGEMNNVNDKGLVSYDREIKKDAFYLYKANWNKEETTFHLCSKDYTQRSESLTDIIVFTTAPSVTLFHDGKKVGSKKTDSSATVEWADYRLHPGQNKISVVSSHGREDVIWTVTASR